MAEVHKSEEFLQELAGHPNSVQVSKPSLSSFRECFCLNSPEDESGRCGKVCPGRVEGASFD